ncbi:hypothetical protein FA13DRAFT_1711312 [Coprinellus micaceus]|uniref:Uncharacterized protein n=1 Tax=Coprinellus micaceus TaxID=71717 RepID=A0A4Y7T5Z0_COPMI|nr:hypothetical protein FA13DRAFT_1711312 [Coprinellus micaceus]
MEKGTRLPKIWMFVPLPWLSRYLTGISTFFHGIGGPLSEPKRRRRRPLNLHIGHSATADCAVLRKNRPRSPFNASRNPSNGRSKGRGYHSPPSRVRDSNRRLTRILSEIEPPSELEVSGEVPFFTSSMKFAIQPAAQPHFLGAPRPVCARKAYLYGLVIAGNSVCSVAIEVEAPSGEAKTAHPCSANETTRDSRRLGDPKGTDNAEIAPPCRET